MVQLRPLLIASLVLFAPRVDAVPNTWTQRANIGGIARYGQSHFTIGSQGYMSSGATVGFSLLNDLWRYDPGTNSWTQLANLPGPGRLYAVGFAIGNKGYVGTGRDNTNGSVLQDFWEYDPVGNSWTQKANFGGGPRSAAAGYCIGSKGYITCGHSGAPPVGFRADHWEYDPVLDTWTQRTNFPGPPRHGNTGFAIGAFGYVGLGGNGASFFDNWRYDPSSDSWTALNPAPFFGGGGVVAGGRAYVSSWTSIWMYRPGPDTWILLTTYPGTSGVVGAGPDHSLAIGNKIYFGAGWTGSNNTFNQRTQDFWEYDPTDCNGVVDGPDMPGASCDDLDPCTINDVLSALCVCAGTYSDLDNDGLCDGNDCDPNDPLVLGPQPWFPDTDGDGYGDALGLIQCTPPPGWVANNSDNCPNIFGLIGDACDDGNPCTTPDIINFACQCLGGLPLDSDGDGVIDCNDNCVATPNANQSDLDLDGIGDVCDNCPLVVNHTQLDTDADGIGDACDLCPLVPGQTGDPCNDGDPNTINDVLNANCVCAGTCTGNTVALTLDTDGNAGQTSWDIVITSTSTVICSGSGYANNSTIVVGCCLPNGCYDLRVFDSFGDGINPGGYVLRDAANNRIIDNFGNGSTFTSTSMSALGFCVPLGSVTLHPASCDVMTATPTTVLHANPDPAVTALYSISTPTVNANTGYQYWITNPNGGFSRRILFTHAAPGTGWPIATPAAQKASYFRLNAMSSPPTVPLGVLLNVRVRPLLNGVYGVFGPACRLYLPVPPCQLSQLTTTASPVISCGATGLSLTSTIYATTVPSATHYQFEFSKTAYLRKITTNVNSVALGFITNPLQNNNCYDVRVRVSMDGGLTYCPYGAVCTIIIGTASCPSMMALDQRTERSEPADDRMSVWPNPNSGAVVNVSLTDFDATVTSVRVDVSDVFGKLVSTRTIPVEGGYLNSILAFEQDLAPGMYIVGLQAGGERFTERLMIQR